MPDTLGSAVYEIDHYLPRKEFPEYTAAWQNLFYACRKCNRRKYKFSPLSNLFIPNPCDHQMADHLQFRGARIKTHTDCGAFMVDLLRLDDKKRQTQRDLVISMIQEKRTQRRDLLSQLKQLKSRLRGYLSAKERTKLEKEIPRILSDLRRIAGHFEVLTGDPQ